MPASTHQLRIGIDAVLRQLPTEYAVASAGEARFVAGRTGAFVLGAVVTTDVDLEAATASLTHLAASTRVTLADHLSWVPFIDAVAVVTGSGQAPGPVTVAPLDLLAELLTSGPRTIATEAMRTVRGLLDQRALGAWRPGIEAADARIDLCDPTASTSRH